MAQNNLERLFLEKELFDFYDALSKEDQSLFKEQLNAYIRQKFIQIRQELELIDKQV
ncbi:MAG: hypothetical protein NW226_05265 [Microscillaceae bacterium]|nr:hypothetical protein [Microscillaceae bacterium]